MDMTEDPELIAAAKELQQEIPTRWGARKRNKSNAVKCNHQSKSCSALEAEVADLLHSPKRMRDTKNEETTLSHVSSEVKAPHLDKLVHQQLAVLHQQVDLLELLQQWLNLVKAHSSYKQNFDQQRHIQLIDVNLSGNKIGWFATASLHGKRWNSSKEENPWL